MENTTRPLVPYIGYPVALHTVDIIPYVSEVSEMSFLLGRKHNSKNFCVMGGFTDPLLDESTEAAAARELMEEAGLTAKGLTFSDDDLNQLQYLGSVKVDDERYQTVPHKIITSVYRIRMSKKGKKKAIAGDDIAEVKWFSFEEILNYKEFVTKKHWPLIEKFIIAKNTY